MCADSNPNEGHEALVELERHFEQTDRNFQILTENIDGLHIVAGSKNVIELHGNINKIRCSK